MRPLTYKRMGPTLLSLEGIENTIFNLVLHGTGHFAANNEWKWDPVLRFFRNTEVIKKA
jgi:hypothetical protein